MNKIKPVKCSDHEIDVDQMTALMAIGWKCMDCSAGNSNEVRECECNDCPLHKFRLKGLKYKGRCNAHKDPVNVQRGLALKNNVNKG